MAMAFHIKVQHPQDQIQVRKFQEGVQIGDSALSEIE